MKTIGDFQIGQSHTSVRRVEQAHIEAFAAASGDYNPVHFDKEFAATTAFETPIAHGMLTASHISAVLGMHFPGPGSIYLEQSLQFLRPVRVGDEIETSVTIIQMDEAKAELTLETICRLGKKAVVKGVARVRLPQTN